MKYEIVELEDFSGIQATIYSVILEDDSITLFDHFVIENSEAYRNELKFIANRILAIGNNTGARAQFFKHNEGKPGDGVCALYDLPNSQLRLYCIRYGNSAILLGGGGPKSKNIKAWQEDEKLTLEAETIIKISKDIMRRINSKELKWSKAGDRLEGNLKISDYE